MAMLDTKVMDPRQEQDIDRKLMTVMDAMEQMKKQFQHALNHLGEESLSDELREQLNRTTAALETASNAADKQAVTSLSKKVEQGLGAKADAKRLHGGQEINLWELLLGLRDGEEAVQLLRSGDVQLSSSGLAIGAEGMDASGNLKAKGGDFSGALSGKEAAFAGPVTVGGKTVLTAGSIVIGAEPATPQSGMVWIEPTTNNSGWNVCTVHYYKE